MYLDWVIIASVITVLVIIWGVAYSVIYMFKHIDKDMRGDKCRDNSSPKA